MTENNDFNKEKQQYISKIANDLDYSKTTNQQTKINYNLCKIKDGDKWYYGYPISEINKDGYIAFQGENKINSYYNLFADAKTLSRFIGICDKNGKEIYTNDIVRVTYLEKRDYMGVSYDNRFKMNELVVFNQKACAFVLQTYIDDIYMYRYIDDFRMDSRKIKIETIEIIGNVFDNPELLEDDDL